MFSSSMIFTKAYLLRSSIAYALSGVRLQRGRQFSKLGLTEDERYVLAARVIAELRKYGEWKELDEEVPVRPHFGEVHK